VPEASSSDEVALTVSDYLDMLSDEIAGRPFSKAEHRRALLPRLRARSEGALEFKYGNVSAALRDLGYPAVDGYQPYSNYQRILRQEVEAQLGTRPQLLALIAKDVSEPAVVPTVDAILAALVPRPQPREAAAPRTLRERESIPILTNYLELEARNRSLGNAGEEFVVRFEQERLIAARQERLASAVEHVSRSRGDGLGYDILSFEDNGRERLIEVKTTRYGRHTPFFITRNEVQASDRHAEQYALYRVFRFREDPRLFMLPGSVRSSCRLDPISFEGRVV
jgi:hypothetical protein